MLGSHKNTHFLFFTFQTPARPYSTIFQTFVLLCVLVPIFQKISPFHIFYRPLSLFPFFHLSFSFSLSCLSVSLCFSLSHISLISSYFSPSYFLYVFLPLCLFVCLSFPLPLALSICLFSPFTHYYYYVCLFVCMFVFHSFYLSLFSLFTCNYYNFCFSLSPLFNSFCFLCLSVYFFFFWEIWIGMVSTSMDIFSSVNNMLVSSIEIGYPWTSILSITTKIRLNTLKLV